MTTLVALTVFVATCIQAWSAAVELGRVRENRAAIDTWNTEDELTAEQPRLQRRRTRRDLRALREPELHREIRRIQLTLASWVMLVAASAYASVASLWP